MHTPPEIFIQAWIIHTQREKVKIGANVNQEIGTQNITGR